MELVKCVGRHLNCNCDHCLLGQLVRRYVTGWVLYPWRQLVFTLLLIICGGCLVCAYEHYLHRSKPTGVS
jgi:hypothetical protein